VEGDEAFTRRRNDALTLVRHVGNDDVKRTTDADQIPVPIAHVFGEAHARPDQLALWIFAVGGEASAVGEFAEQPGEGLPSRVGGVGSQGRQEPGMGSAIVSAQSGTPVRAQPRQFPSEVRSIQGIFRQPSKSRLNA